MIGWLKRTGAIALAGIGLLAAGVLALGVGADLLVNLVRFAVGAPMFLYVATAAGVIPALVLLWLWDRRRRP